MTAPAAATSGRDAERPLVHDHAPRHGGVVAMSGSYHVEALADAGGGLRVYVSDMRRKPLAPDGIEAFAVVGTGAAERRVRLVANGDALVATVPRPPGPFVDVRVEGRLEDEPLLIDFTLPVAATADSTSRLGKP